VRFLDSPVSFMKVLHVVPSFHPAYSYGGPIRSTFELCRNLAQLGSEVRVLTTDADGLDRVLNVDKTKEVELPEGFRVRYCPRRQRHSVSPTLMHLLPVYMRWADEMLERSLLGLRAYRQPEKPVQRLGTLSCL